MDSNRKEYDPPLPQLSGSWESKPGGNTKYDRGYSISITAILVSLVILIGYIEAMLTPSLLNIAGDFSVSRAQVTLVLSMYLVGGVAFSPINGKLGDIYGKKLLISITMLIYSAAVFTTGFSSSFSMLVISRTIQGTGLAILPLGLSLAREEFPKEMIPQVQALISAFYGVSFAVGLPLGSFVSNTWGWRVTYYTAIPFVLTLAVLSIFVMRESRYRRPGATVDYVGASVLALLLGLFVYFLSQGPTWGWPYLSAISLIISLDFARSTWTTLLLLSCAVLLLLLVWYELSYQREGKDAILNFRLLSMRNVFIANIALVVASMGLFLATQSFAYRLEYPVPAGFGKSVLWAGLTVTPFALGGVLGGVLAASFVKRMGSKPLSVLGALLASAGFFLEATLPGYTLLWIYSIIGGAGITMMMGTLNNYIVLTVQPRDMGIATGMNAVFRNIGNSLGAPIAASVLTTFTSVFMVQETFNVNGVSQARMVPVTLASGSAFVYVFLIAAIALLCAAVLIALGREVVSIRPRDLQSYAPSVGEGESTLRN